MTESLVPSEQNSTLITDGQIDKVLAMLRQQLIAARNTGKLNLQSVDTQYAVEKAGALVARKLGGKLVEPFRKVINEIQRMQIITVDVDRTRSPDKAMEATGWEICCADNFTMKSMPKKGRNRVNVIFLEPDDSLHSEVGHLPLSEKVDDYYQNRFLKAADPYSLAAVFEHGFGETLRQKDVFRRNYVTHWKSRGTWYFLRFDLSERKINMGRCGEDWPQCKRVPYNFAYFAAMA